MAISDSIMELQAVYRVIMVEEDQRVDLSSTDQRESGEEKRVTSVMDGALFDELEEWRAARGMSRSEAVRQLVAEGVHDEQWLQKIKDAQETLEREEVVAFTTAAIAKDGGVNVRLEARDGVDGDYPVNLEGGMEALAVGVLMLLKTYSQGLDVEMERLLAALNQMHTLLEESDDVDDFDIGGGS